MPWIINHWEPILCFIMIVSTIYYIYRLLDKHLLGEIFAMNKKDLWKWW